MPKPALAALLTLIVLAPATAGAALVQPDTASASSAFSGSYVPQNTINGSGLPAGFTPADAHANYGGGNHWTTSGAAPTDQFITWGFDAPVTLGGIHIWNHRSNVIAANPGYEPVLFDLTLFDSASNVLLYWDDVALLPDTAVAQTFGFGGLIANVSSVRFDVEATQSSTSYTGLAEVAFSTSAVPVPGAAWLLGSALAGVILVTRRRHG